MSLRIGFELETIGLLGVGATAGYLATEMIAGSREKTLYKLSSIKQGAGFIGGWVETRKGGVNLPDIGDEGILPATLRNRMIGINLQSDLGLSVAGRLAIEFGPFAGQAGKVVYKKDGLRIWINNFSGDINFMCRADECDLMKVYPDVSSFFGKSLKKGQEIWENIMSG